MDDDPPHQVYDIDSATTMTVAPDHLTFATGAYAWSVESATGELVESYPHATPGKTMNPFLSTICLAVARSQPHPMM